MLPRPEKRPFAREKLKVLLDALDRALLNERLAVSCQIVDTHDVAWDTFRMAPEVLEAFSRSRGGSGQGLSQRLGYGIRSRSNFIRLTAQTGEVSLDAIRSAVREVGLLTDRSEAQRCVAYNLIALSSLARSEGRSVLTEIATELENYIDHSGETGATSLRAVLALADFHLHIGDLARSEELTKTFQYLHEHLRSRDIDFRFLFFRLRLYLAANDLPSVRECLEQAQLRTKPENPLELAYLRQMEAAFFLRTRDYYSAEVHAKEAQALAVDAGPPRHHLHVFHLFAGLALATRQKHLEASFSFARALASANCRDHDVVLENFQLVKSAHFLSIGQESSADETLKYALKRRLADKGGGLLTPIPEVASVLCDRALAQGFATNFIKTRVHEQRLSPGDVLSGWWPWPVSVRFLGRAQISLAAGGEPRDVITERNRLSDLLLVLAIAHPTPVPLRELATVMGELAHDAVSSKAIDASILRIRRQIGATTIVVSSGLVSLNDARVWTDLSALRLAHFRSLELSSHGESETRRLAEQALNLYRGDLAVDVSHPMVRTARRLAAFRFEDILTRCVERLISLKQLAAASHYCRQGLQSQPAAKKLQALRSGSVIGAGIAEAA